MPGIPPYSDDKLPERFFRWLEELRNILKPIPIFIEGPGTPEGAIAAKKGARYYRTDGSAGTFLYVKTTDSGNTGWIAYA